VLRQARDDEPSADSPGGGSGTSAGRWTAAGASGATGEHPAGSTVTVVVAPALDLVVVVVRLVRVEGPAHDAIPRQHSSTRR
jgi:hypothetical protein